MGGKSDALKYAIWKLIKRGLKLKSFGRHTRTHTHKEKQLQGYKNKLHMPWGIYYPLT